LCSLALLSDRSPTTAPRPSRTIHIWYHHGARPILERCCAFRFRYPRTAMPNCRNAGPLHFRRPSPPCPPCYFRECRSHSARSRWSGAWGARNRSPGRIIPSSLSPTRAFPIPSPAWRPLAVIVAPPKACVFPVPRRVLRRRRPAPPSPFSTNPSPRS
jgi:hypothetical protein